MKVILTAHAWKLMRGYVDLCKNEISGLGKVERDDAGNFIVTDIAIFEQTVSGAHSDISAESLAKFQVERIQQGESMKDWYLWWHSHADMSAFFSGRDTATIDESTDFGLLLSIVTNHKHDFVARVDVYEPVRLFTTLQVETLEENDKEILDLCQKEITAKVKQPSYGAGYQFGKTKTRYQKHKKGKKHHKRTVYVHDDEEEDPTYPPTGFSSAQELLPSAEQLELPTPMTEADTEQVIADYEEYMEEKDLLIDAIIKAKEINDPSAVQAARTELLEHIQKGRQRGFEN